MLLFERWFRKREAFQLGIHKASVVMAWPSRMVINSTVRFHTSRRTFARSIDLCNFILSILDLSSATLRISIVVLEIFRHSSMSQRACKTIKYTHDTISVYTFSSPTPVRNGSTSSTETKCSSSVGWTSRKVSLFECKMFLIKYDSERSNLH